jgi:hypothetical protein
LEQVWEEILNIHPKNPLRNQGKVPHAWYDEIKLIEDFSLLMLMF